DGSVRFIEQNVSDAVFKAMCTVGGGAPEDFDVKKNPSTPLVPAPKKDEVTDIPVALKVPSKTDPVVKVDPGQATQPAGKLPPGWVTFTAPDGSFSVGMPQQPMSQTLTEPTLGKLTIYVAAVPAKKIAFTATTAKVPEPLLATLKTPDGL